MKREWFPTKAAARLFAETNIPGEYRIKHSGEYVGGWYIQTPKGKTWRYVTSP